MRLFSIPALFLFLLLPALTAFAQPVLKGIVTDEQNQPLPFVAASLRNRADSTLVSSELSDSLGTFYFHIPGDAQGLFIAMHLLGYETKRSTVPASSEDTILLPVQLKATEKMLNSVEVTNNRPLIERRTDRTVFNTGNSIAATGSDAFELLKKAPGVQISNNVISITGKSTVSVMINDRLIQLSGSELESMLRSMAGSNISKIEIITAPPAKYDAEGNSGIINIITRKQNKNGFNGTATLSHEQRTKGSESIQSTFNFRKNKLNIFGNVNANKYRFVTVQETNTQYPEQKQEQVLNQDNRPFYTWSQIGADWTLNEKSVIGILYTHGTMDTKREELIQTNILQLPSRYRDSFMITDAVAKDFGVRNVFNLNYDWKIDTAGKKASFNIDHFVRTGRKSRDFTTEHFYPNGNTAFLTNDNQTYGKIQTGITTARIDMEWPGSLINCSFGAKASAIHNASDNIFNYLSGYHYVTDSGKTNAFDYRENTQAAYVSTSKSWSKWEVQLGLRAEYTQTKGKSLTLNELSTNDYFKVFPTAYLQYKIGQGHSLSLNYSKRINRPSFWNMNPFRVYSTATAYEQGNPFLQPSFSNNTELTYNVHSGFSLTAFIQKTDAYATRVSQINTVNNSFYFTQANAGNNVQYGINASVNFLPVPWWESNTELSAAHSVFSSSFYNNLQVHYHQSAFSFETNNSFTLNKAKTFMAEVNFNYAGKSQSDFDVQSAYCNLGAGFKYLFFNKNLIAAINISDIFRTDAWKVMNQYNGTFQYSYFDNRCLRFSITGKFGNQSIKGRRNRSSSSEEVKRAG